MSIASAVLLAAYFVLVLYAGASPSNDPQRGMAQGFIILVALVLLYSKLHYAWSFALLAVAINFKVVPVVLAPVWIVGSMPGDQRLSLRQPRVLAGLGLRSALLAALVIGSGITHDGSALISDETGLSLP